MARTTPLPYFGLPPREYDPVYFSEVTRAFATYMQQASAPGPMHFQQGGDSATQAGVMLWDAANGYPVVSKGGEWREVVLADGYARLERTTDVSAAAADTAYAIEYGAPTLASSISLDGTDATRIVFEEGGLFLLAFTAQISSTSSSTVEFRFWPRLNGTDAPGATILAKLHQNDASTVVSRTTIFTVSAGDYLQVMWAVDGTAGHLLAAPATAYAPAAPSTTLAIERIRAG
jgi:hypothetical protein